MLLSEVAYARPTSIADAIELLTENPGARALAGGQTLISVLKARAAVCDALVDLNDLDELRQISVADDGTIEIGSMSTYSAIAASPQLGRRSVIGEVCAQIADVQIRNRGTIGGNLCTSDPTNHLPPLLTALSARMTIVGRQGARAVGAGEFFLGVYTTAVQPGELLTLITIPPGGADGFAAVTHGVEGTCLVNAAACLTNGTRLALGCVAAVPVVLDLDSREPENIRTQIRSLDLDPPADVHATAEYRRHLAEVVAIRAVQHAEKNQP